MTTAHEILPIVIYILLIILLIVGIIIGIKVIIDMTKVEKVVDDVSDKLNSVSGFFRIMDATTDRLAMLSDSIVTVLTTVLSKVFNIFKKEKKEEEDINEEI